MSFEIDPNLIENRNILITEDGSGNLTIEHQDSGSTLTIDGSMSISGVNNKTSGLSNDGSNIALDFLRLTVEDLTARDPSYDNEVAFHDGTDGSEALTRGLCFAASSTSWYSVRDGVTF